MTTSILEPGQIEAGARSAPLVVVPPADVFAGRARRFAELAEGHALADYLRFMGRLAAAQDLALGRAGVAVNPGPEVAQALAHGMPPLPAASLALGAAFFDDLRTILHSIAETSHETIRELCLELGARPAGELVLLARHLLEGAHLGPEGHLAPFVAAALQVYWVRLARTLPAGVVKPIEPPTVCPCCGSRPVVSVVHIGNETGVRYLHCSLCSTEWHYVRVKCTACEGTADIHYHSVTAHDTPEDAEPAALRNAVVRAESCDSCRSYLKLVSLEVHPNADACADDLATLSLDFLMDEAGYLRSGPNLLFVAGDSE